MMIRVFQIGAIGAVAALVACAPVVPPTVECDFTPLAWQSLREGPALAEPTGAMRPVPLNTVSVTDMAISNKVLVQSVHAGRTPTGTTEVMARVVNCTDFPLQVDGRTHFLDQAQRPTEPVSAWQRVHLAARSIGVYRETSTDDANVGNFLIELREGR